MNGIITAIAATKAIILFLGGGITYIAFKAYRRSDEPSIGVLGIGFGVITVGALLTGVANQFFSVSLEIGVLVNSVFVAVGLAVIMYSLYMQR
ncbi:hypothetical protein SAMN04488065_2669 [Haloplanus vescus]|jgi:hypothetical protein|uniref:Uncharacterized protein n=1 Tax=Haloplanus vescus TaxID=555874 RepID=A0A1H4A910_9EURY|nr:hypothetical protein [Haloplanus vescus]SEA32479.1 hypothetical protein SAMN04488065_2669 [Haloplanus vescus]